MISFVINGIAWKFEFVSPRNPALKRPDGSFAIGVCDNKMKMIYIVAGLSEDRFKKVLAHEITHAAMYSYQVKLTVDQEELLADIFSTYGNEIVNVTNRVFKKIKRQGRL